MDAWPEGKPIRLTVTYSACVAEACHVLKQEYVLHLRRDKDGGGARGAGAGLWGEEFAKQMLARSKRGDGKVNKTEVMGLILPHFDKLDADKDGYLDLGELKAVAEWLNRYHQPSPPAPKPKK